MEWRSTTAPSVEVYGSTGESSTRFLIAHQALSHPLSQFRSNNIGVMIDLATMRGRGTTDTTSHDQMTGTTTIVATMTDATTRTASASGRTSSRRSSTSTEPSPLVGCCNRGVLAITATN